MLYTSRVYILLCASIMNTISFWHLFSSPTIITRNHNRSHSLPSPSDHLLVDLEAQLQQKDAHQEKKTTRCSTYTYPSMKAILFAGFMFSAGWVLKDLSKVVNKVDNGVDSLGEKLESGLEAISQILDEIKDRLDGDHTLRCPDARTHMKKMYQALRDCNAPSPPDQSWYIQEDTFTSTTEDGLFVSCPMAKFHFTRMIISVQQCRQTNSTWFNASEMPA